MDFILPLSTGLTPLSANDCKSAAFAPPSCSSIRRGGCHDQSGQYPDVLLRERVLRRTCNRGRKVACLTKAERPFHGGAGRTETRRPSSQILSEPGTARLPRAATQPPRRREAWLRIFVVRCGLPCDPPVKGHSCNGGRSHGLRASELCDLQWSQVELATGRLHVRRAKNGSPSVHPMQGDDCSANRPTRPGPARRLAITPLAKSSSSPRHLRVISSATSRTPLSFGVDVNGGTGRDLERGSHAAALAIRLSAPLSHSAKRGSE